MLLSLSSRWSSASMCGYMTLRRANSLYTPSRLSLTRNGWGSAPAAAKARISWASKIAEARDDLKLFRPCDYPVIRGTALQIGDRHAFLWTAGYAPRLDTFMGPETPNPISVKVLRGNCSLQAVLSDVLGLTKINFNSCLHNGRLPVTVRFANAVATFSSQHRWTASRSCLQVYI
jgi:hypothetical protein